MVTNNETKEEEEENSPSSLPTRSVFCHSTTSPYYQPLATLICPSKKNCLWPIILYLTKKRSRLFFLAQRTTHGQHERNGLLGGGDRALR